MFRSCATVSALLALTACSASRPGAAAPSPSGASVAQAAATARADAPKHMLFRVSGPQGAVVYLLGSVHLLSADAATLPALVDTALDRAVTVAFEANIDTLHLRAMELFSRARLPEGQSLRDVLQPATYAALERRLPEYDINLQQLTRMKPWVVSLAVTQATVTRAQFKVEHGVDIQIHTRAKAAGKRVIGLESVSFQLGLFDALLPADQELMLVEQMIPPDSAVQQLVTVKNAWMRGDTITLNASLNRVVAKSPTLYAALLSDRNRSWMPAIEALINGRDDALVVVGAAHLVGQASVLDFLRRKGYRIEQL